MAIKEQLNARVRRSTPNLLRIVLQRARLPSSSAGRLAMLLAMRLASSSVSTLAMRGVVLALAGIGIDVGRPAYWHRGPRASRGSSRPSMVAGSGARSSQQIIGVGASGMGAWPRFGPTNVITFVGRAARATCTPARKIGWPRSGYERKLRFGKPDWRIIEARVLGRMISLIL
jgi:hypothetical protein